MKLLSFKTLLTVSVLTLSATSMASLLQFDFSNFGSVSGSDTTFSSAGDTWIATDALVNPSSGNLDARFQIVATSHASTGSFAFRSNANEPGQRASSARMRVDSAGQSFPAWAVVEVSFFEAGSTVNPFLFTSGSQMIAQFDDLDSDVEIIDGDTVERDYSDFAGIRVGDFNTAILTNDTLLEHRTEQFGSDDYRIGILQEPWGPQENETSIDPADQAPFTARFDTVLSQGVHTFRFVVGVDGGEDEDFLPNRHIDLDMFANPVIVPEPGALLLAGILLGSFGGLHLLKRRKK